MYINTLYLTILIIYKLISFPGGDVGASVAGSGAASKPLSDVWRDTLSGATEGEGGPTTTGDGTQAPQPPHEVSVCNVDSKSSS